MALLPCSHLRFAIPSRFLSSHRILPGLLPIFSGTNLPFPIFESICGYYFLSQILLEPLSIGNLSAERKRYPTAPFENPVSFAPDQVDADIAAADRVLLPLVSRPLLFPKARRILSTISRFVYHPLLIILCVFFLL